MGLVRADGKAKWSEGVCHLIELGMGERDAVGTTPEPEDTDQLREVRREKKRLERENEALRERIGALDGSGGSEVPNPAERQLESECEVLSVLCSDRHAGVDSPNYVYVDTIVQETDMDRSAVVHALDVLARRYPRKVVDHPSKGKVKITDSDVYEVHCHE
ncbi:hypothetical protein BRC90_10090 [Halobacteriales archaeon QS_4_69_34]|nr:MAG: hypothetical protein BRC90_10090 [Halobacteriales archaeon QS_4_69_34]